MLVTSDLIWGISGALDILLQLVFDLKTHYKHCCSHISINTISLICEISYVLALLAVYSLSPKKKNHPSLEKVDFDNKTNFKIQFWPYNMTNTDVHKRISK